MSISHTRKMIRCTGCGEVYYSNLIKNRNSFKRPKEFICPYCRKKDYIDKNSTNIETVVVEKTYM